MAWAAALAAALTALVAAIATSWLSALLLQRAENRRLREAAVVLAKELQTGPATVGHARAIVRDEVEETRHTGIVFSVYDARGVWMAGEHFTTGPPSNDCAPLAKGLQGCRATAAHGLVVVAASRHVLPSSLFALAAVAAAVFAAVAAWMASRPLSRAIVSPLSSLRAQLARVDLDAGSASALGPPDGVTEVDDLRLALERLLQHVHEAIDQAKRFAANAAHELRTPLTSVRGELQLLLEDPELKPNSAVNVSRAERKVSELGVLIERLLILATPRAVPSEVREIVSLRDVVEDAVLSMPPSDQRNIATPDTDALVQGDSALLSAAVINALSNGIKFGQRVKVDLVLEEATATLRVIDDGPGVPSTDRARVFEPFFRSSTMLPQAISGHGLGLALVRHVAQVHGGSASFAEAAKTTLEIRLPIAQSECKP